MREPDPWYVEETSLEGFILGMLALGVPLETALVGAFDPAGRGRGSRQDVDLPLHQDGVYSQALADVQGGHYVERPGIDIVGLYCIRGGSGRCVTLIDAAEVELLPGQALVFDNRRVLHGRCGTVGERLLLRVWMARRPGG